VLELAEALKKTWRIKFIVVDQAVRDSILLPT
jgi:hypothetical protein